MKRYIKSATRWNAYVTEYCDGYAVWPFSDNSKFRALIYDILRPEDEIIKINDMDYLFWENDNSKYINACASAILHQKGLDWGTGGFANARNQFDQMLKYYKQAINANIDKYTDAEVYTSVEQINGTTTNIRIYISSRIPEGKERNRLETWKGLKEVLEEDCDYGDPIYEGTEAGLRLLELQHEVEADMGLYLEPSIQAGRGSIVIYSDDQVVGYCDFQNFNMESIQLAFESRGPVQYKKKYAKLLQKAIDDYEPDDDYNEAW